MEYMKGMQLRLLSRLDDPYTPKEAGDILTVSYVDDADQVHGTWASGGSLAIIPEVDKFEVVKGSLSK